MRRWLLCVLLIATPATADPIARTAHIPHPWLASKYVPLRAALEMPLFQVAYTPPSGGGGGGVTIGAAITSGADCRVLYDNAGVVGEDANFCWTDASNAAYLKIGSGTAPGAIRFLEGSGSGVNYAALTIATTLAADITITLPTGSTTTTLAGLANDQVFTGSNTFTRTGNFGSVYSDNTYLSLGTGTDAAYVVTATAQTPDSLQVGVDPDSNALHVIERGDNAFDFQNGACGTSACTDPAVTIHSRNQDTQEWVSVWHNGNMGQIAAANSTARSGTITLGRTVALTEAGAAETVITITTATTETFGLELSYSVTATDATNRATREGSLKLVCDNAAGTLTCTKDATTQADDESVLIATGGATLTYAIAVDVATANVAKITFDIDSTLVVSAASITFTAVLNGPGTIS